VLTNITVLVSANGPDRIWIRSIMLDNDVRTSESIYMYSDNIGNNLTFGDVISLSPKVAEYRSAATYLYPTKLRSPKYVTIISSW
jgi:hypothetical protein